MANKTCGECIHFDSEISMCCLHDDHFVESYYNTVACDKFEPVPKPTNGDKIRAMSNEELAIEFATITNCGNCDDCSVKDYCTTECCDPIPAWIAYFNAPADCVKQNGNHDTQPNLSKADNTESEGEDE